MADSAALLVDEILPHQPMRQWVLSVPFPLRFLFASQPAVMGKVVGIVYRTIAPHLIQKAGYIKATAPPGSVTQIQCFGGALNENLNFQLFFLLFGFCILKLTRSFLGEQHDEILINESSAVRNAWLRLRNRTSKNARCGND